MLTKLIRRGLAALGFALLAIAPTVPAEARTNRGPALWEVSDKDTTIYLFGTIHLLPRDSQWRTPRFDKAVQSSQSLVLETLIDSANPQQLAGVMAALGYSSGLPPIAERVPIAKRPQLEAAIAKTRIPRALFDRMETWAASFTLLGVQFQTLGSRVSRVSSPSFAARSQPPGSRSVNSNPIMSSCPSSTGFPRARNASFSKVRSKTLRPRAPSSTACSRHG